MPKTKISEFSATANSNTDINSINIAEGCAPSNINDAIRELMAELKDFQAGTKGDSFNGPVNGTVGATTPASGAFTTLSSTGNTTLGDASGDTVTINGTTTFVNVNPTLSAGTANGVLYLNGSKVATSGSALTFDGTTLSNSTSGTPFSLNRTGAATALIELKQSGTVGSYLGTSGSNDMIFFNGSASELMRINGTGLGIGTSSPANKLHINSGASTTAALIESTGTSVFTGLKNSGSIAYIGADNTGAFLVQTPGSGFSTKLTVDSSGNLGLGVTPSAWQSGRKALQVGNASINSFSNSQNQLGANFYYDGTNNKYISSDFSTVYQQLSGQHQWYTAASGTAGNTITFTQAMTLDASGNLLVGATSNGNGYKIYAKNNNTSTTSLVLENNNGGYQVYTQNQELAFFQLNVGERARIDSSGNLLIGKTSTGLAVGIQLEANGGSSFIRSSSSNSDLNLYVYSTGASAARFYVGMGGTVYATNTTISAISDQRFKENIQDIDVGLDAIMALKPRKFDWKAGQGKDIKGDRGFIAQEIEQVFPDLVDQWADPAPEGEEPYKSVRQDLIPVLVKAIQEQQAIIEQLTSRIQALENK